MTKAVKLASIVIISTVILTLSISSAALADTNYYDNVGNTENPGMGPAPNFGDGIHDGPGW